jgi:hypothetical protein
VAYTLDPSTGIYIDPVSGATSMDPLGQTAVTNPSLVSQAKRNLAVSHGLLDTLGKYGQQFDQSISGEKALSQHLNDVIAGQAPSVAGQQLQQGLGQVRQQADSMASGASGANAGAARLQAIQSGGAAAAGVNQQAAMLRATEQAAAVQNQGAVLGNIAGQSANMYGTNVTGAANFSNQAGTEAAQQAQIDEQRREANLRLITNLAAAGGAGLATLATGGAAAPAAGAALSGIASGQAGNAASNIAGSSGVVANPAAAPMPEQLDSAIAGASPSTPADFSADAILGARSPYQGPDINPTTGGLSSGSAYTSDENEKQDLQKPDNEAMEQFLDHISGFTYEGKPGSDIPAGKRMGPMAQDVQQGGPIGKSMVIDGAPLKMDVANTLGSTLAAVSYLNDQIKQLRAQR